MLYGRTLLVAIGAILISGCATSDTTYLADGRLGHVIDCTGNRKGWEACVTKAGNLCGARGYNVISKDGETTPSDIAGLHAGMEGPRSSRRTLVVACKG